MKKVWIIYNGIAVLLLATLIALDYYVNVVQDYSGIHTIFTGIALYFCAFIILIAMPIWIVVLLVNRSKMDGRSLGIGLVLFLLFLGMTAYPVVAAIGYIGP